MPPSAYGSRLGRLLQRECLTAIDTLASPGDPHARVHQARKAIRRVRSVLALVAPAFDVSAIDGLLRRTGESLGALRDAHAVADTARRIGTRVADPRWSRVAAALDARADRLVDRELAIDPDFARRRRALARAARQLDALPWDVLEAGNLRAGLQRQRRRVEKAARRARQDPVADTLHRWRRRVRRLRMQLDALQEMKLRALDPDPAVSRRLHRLSDELGWRQDLVVLSGSLQRMRTLDDRRGLRAQLDREDLQVLERGDAALRAGATATLRTWPAPSAQPAAE